MTPDLTPLAIHRMIVAFQELDNARKILIRDTIEAQESMLRCPRCGLTSKIAVDSKTITICHYVLQELKTFAANPDNREPDAFAFVTGISLVAVSCFPRPGV